MLHVFEGSVWLQRVSGQCRSHPVDCQREDIANGNVPVICYRLGANIAYACGATLGIWKAISFALFLSGKIMLCLSKGKCRLCLRCFSFLLVVSPIVIWLLQVLLYDLDKELDSSDIIDFLESLFSSYFALNFVSYMPWA